MKRRDSDRWAAEAALVGARGPDDDGDASGSVYVFRYDGAAWIEEVKLTASDAAAGNGFGASVAVAGGTAVIGSSQSAYVFGDDGTDWVEEGKLESSDGTQDDLFGASVAVANDTALVGAPRHGLGGAAYVFLIPEPSRWALDAGAFAVLAGLARRGRCVRPGRRRR